MGPLGPEIPSHERAWVQRCPYIAPGGWPAHPMARKKSLDELDAELAELEAELEALEEGGGPGPKPKPRKAPKPAKQAAPPPEEPEPEPAGEAEEAAPEPTKKRRLRLRRGKPVPEAPSPPDRAEPEPPPPAEAKSRRPKLPFGRRAKAEAPEPPTPETEDAPSSIPSAPIAAPPELPRGAPHWERGASGWRVAAPPSTGIPVVRRRVDAQGQTIEEEVVAVAPAPPAAGAEPTAPPEEPVRSGRFRFGRRRGAAPPEPEGEDEPPPLEPEAAPAEAPPPRRRRRRVIVPLIILLLLIIVVAVLAASGVVDVGGGGIGGIGGNKAPVAHFALSATVAAIATNVSFDASSSSDPEGDTLTYAWEFGDGGGQQGVRVTHAYAARGDYFVQLTVRDAKGATGTTKESLQILPPPAARIRATVDGSAVGGNTWPVNGTEVAFDGTGSTADGGVKGYDWTFGDGARGAGPSVSHAFARSGVFQVTLSVSDGNGLRGVASQPVYVGVLQSTDSAVPESTMAPQAQNQTFPVAGISGALPARPVLLRATLTFPASQFGALPLPVPGNVDPDDLDLRIYDAAGAVVAELITTGAPKQLEVTDFSGALGSWSIEVSRPQGGANPVAYTLDVSLIIGPP